MENRANTCTVLNFGSLNLDFVYKVEQFVKAGETKSALSLEQHIGGKGLNQSVALARAGAKVTHAGFIGDNGQSLKAALIDADVNVEHLKSISGPSGHAIIQVNTEGENCILIHGGANLAFDESYIDSLLATARQGDLILLQNEINHVPMIMQKAKAKQLKVVFNAAPMNKAVLDYPLECVDLFIINQGEGQSLTGEKSVEGILQAMQDRYPNASVVLTLGEMGACYRDKTQNVHVRAECVKAVDTTGAGDTFTGFFLAKWIENCSIEHCLSLATRAAGICITRPGAANAIPYRHEIE